MLTKPRFLLAALTSLLVLSSWPARGQVSFVEASGGYSGLALPDQDINPADVTALNLNLTPTGRVTGTFRNAGIRRSFRGRFDPADGTFDHLLPAGDVIRLDGSRVPFFYLITAQLDPANRTMTGRVDPQSGEANVLGAAFTLSGAPPDPEIGDALAGNRQTSFVDPPDPSTVDGLDIPGDGFTLVKVGKSKTRPARLVGKLPDGANYSTGTPLQGTRYAVLSPLFTLGRISRSGNVTIRSFDYQGSTYGFGEVTAPSASPPEWLLAPTARSLAGLTAERALTGFPALVAALRWHQLPITNSTFIYGQGVRTNVNVDARFYPRTPREGLVPIGLDPLRRENATITLRRGNMAAPVEAAITIRRGSVRFERMIGADTGVGGNPYRIRVSMNALVGSFTGSFSHPVTGQRTPFSGAFRAKVGNTPGQGRGAFRGSLSPEQVTAGATLESGSVRITVN